MGGSRSKWHLSSVPLNYLENIPTKYSQCSSEPRQRFGRSAGYCWTRGEFLNCYLFNSQSVPSNCWELVQLFLGTSFLSKNSESIFLPRICPDRNRRHYKLWQGWAELSWAELAFWASIRNYHRIHYIRLIRRPNLMERESREKVVWEGERRRDIVSQKQFIPVISST